MEMTSTAGSRSGETMARLLRVLRTPSSAVQAVWKRNPIGSFDLRSRFEVFDRPAYAYGVQQGAFLASRLGLPAISVIEFGVAGGRGLLALEEIARLAARAYGVEIEVYGFDRAVGLPKSADYYRDLPYTWQAGFYAMDVDELLARLRDARLVLGDINETVPTFVDTYDPAPVAFVAVDLVYYSSTMYALQIFDVPHSRVLPRVLCYFDDIVGEDHVLQNEYVGELLAIHEFNLDRKECKILPANGLAAKRVLPADWNESMLAMHRFDHPNYDTYVGPPKHEQQLAL
jgi:hypothetical protein